MEVGIIFIIATMLVMAPIAIIFSKTKLFQEIEDRFFEDHDHYM